MWNVINKYCIFDEEFARICPYHPRPLSSSPLIADRRIGCELVDSNSWSAAPLDIPIIGLKELPVSDEPSLHTYIQFAHRHKRQAGWTSVSSRFQRGGGTLYDLEFLTDATGRRVAAFGFHAGFIATFAAQRQGKALGFRLDPYANMAAMINNVKAALGGSGKGARALVIGAPGRCGSRAVDLFRKIGLDESYLLSVRHQH